MAAVLTLDERRRKSRNILFAAFAVLIILWTIKLSFPQHTALTVYVNHKSQSVPTEPAIPAGELKPIKVPGSHGKLKSKPSGNIVLSGSQNLTNSDKTAVIIETRFRTNLIPLILHFSAVLGPTWPILIYTSAESVGLFAASAALSRYLRAGFIQIRILPQTVLFTDSDSVNEFMTKGWLWESLAPAENILIFQSDSMLCANAARSVEDYFEYDLVGAPIASSLEKGYKGGLSLRKRSSTMRVLENWDWEKTKKEEDQFEDQWYYNRLLQLQKDEKDEGIEPEDGGAINLPSMEVARTFAVDTIDYPHPLGVQQVHRWSKLQILSLDKWCPEHKLCSEEFMVGR